MADWRALRVALGLTQVDMAELMQVSDREIRNYEDKAQHTCPSKPSLRLVQAWLRAPQVRSRVLAAGVGLPVSLR